MLYGERVGSVEESQSPQWLTLSKQASNMNFGLMLSCNVEDKLLQHARTESWTQADEAKAYETCLKKVLEENDRAWADGNIRIGDYIVLSTSRVSPKYLC
jgi:hypothetical protein